MRQAVKCLGIYREFGISGTVRRSGMQCIKSCRIPKPRPKSAMSHSIDEALLCTVGISRSKLIKRKPGRGLLTCCDPSPMSPNPTVLRTGLSRCSMRVRHSAHYYSLLTLERPLLQVLCGRLWGEFGEYADRNHWADREGLLPTGLTATRVQRRFAGQLECSSALAALIQPVGQ